MQPYCVGRKGSVSPVPRLIKPRVRRGAGRTLLFCPNQYLGIEQTQLGLEGDNLAYKGF